MPLAQLHLGLYSNFNWRNTGKQTACSNLSCTLVMEQGRQKSKRLAYTAKFKREVIWCAKDKGNRKAAAVFGVDESNVRLWRKNKAAISWCEVHPKVKLLKTHIFKNVLLSYRRPHGRIIMSLFRKLKLSCTCSNSTSLPTPHPWRPGSNHPQSRPPQHTHHMLKNSFP